MPVRARVPDGLVDRPAIRIIEPMAKDTSRGRRTRPVEIRTLCKRPVEAGMQVTRPDAARRDFGA